MTSAKSPLSKSRGEASSAEFAPAGTISFPLACDRVRVAWYGSDAISFERIQRIHALAEEARRRSATLALDFNRPSFFDLPRLPATDTKPRGLLGLAALMRDPLPPPRTAVDQNLRRQETLNRAMNEELRRLVQQHDEARAFVRAQCSALPARLQCIVIDQFGTRRRAQPRAWLSEDNWKILLKERVFESGTDPLEPKGRPLFFEDEIADCCTHLILYSELAGPNRGSLATYALAVAPKKHSPIASRRQSATNWYQTIGHAEAEAALKREGMRISQRSRTNKAAQLWNARYPDAQRTADVFKKAEITKKKGKKPRD